MFSFFPGYEILYEFNTVVQTLSTEYMHSSLNVIYPKLMFT